MEGNKVIIEGNEYVLKYNECKRKTGVCKNYECLHCYNRSFISNPKSQFLSLKNGDIIIRMIPQYSDKKYIFDCNNCNHEFNSTITHIFEGKWCCYCCIPGKRLCNDISCMYCHKRSFASHPKAKFWSIKNCIPPREVFLNSNKKFWFDCDKCSHTYLQTINGILTRDRNCRFCQHQELCEATECSFCFNNSFASRKECKNWSKEKNGNITPRNVFLGTNKKYWFDCDVCIHSYKQKINIITSKGCSCPYCCTSNSLLCDDDKCIFCFQRSFASHEKAKYWSAKNSVSPRYVFKKSDSVKYLFNCNYCYVDFEAYPWHIFDGRWCNKCKHKTEKLVYDYLTDNNYLFIHQYNKLWKDERIKYSFDFYLSEYNIILEIDGPQHFHQTSNWKSPENTQKRDVLKMKRAIECGITIIRILQEEIWKNSIDWRDIIKQYVKKYDIPQILYFANNPSIYDNHINLYNESNFKLNEDNIINDLPEDHILEAKNDKIKIDLSKLML